MILSENLLGTWYMFESLGWSTCTTIDTLSIINFSDADGKYVVKFGVLFADDRCANIFEALVGTLKAAKKRKILTYQGELLLQGVHDNVDITLLIDHSE